MKLLDYIRGLRKGKEAHRLEKESMQDPFLADAMDGYSQVEGNHEQHIEKLRMRVAAHSAKRRNQYAIGWSIAACLVIGIGISTYFLFLKNSVGEDMFIAKENMPTAEIAPAAPKDEVASLPSVKVSQDSVHEVTAKTVDKKDMVAKTRTKAVPKPQAAPVAAAPVIEETAEPIALDEEKGTLDTIRPESNRTKMKTAKAFAPAIGVIKGKVTDDKGEPIVGATVYYKGTKIGTTTNWYGEFAIPKREGNEKLIANFIGYKTAEIPIDTSKTLLIAMNESNEKFDEVAIVGFGTNSKSTSTKTESSSDKQTDSLTPEPVGGMRQFRKYLKENLIHPTDTVCAEVKGEVVLTFLVNKKGRPYQIEVKQSLCESADKEAIRLVQEGPDWTYVDKLAEITVKF